MRATKAQIQALLTDLLRSVRETYVDEGFNGSIYHWTFEEKAVEKVEKFLEAL